MTRKFSAKFGRQSCPSGLNCSLVHSAHSLLDRVYMSPYFPAHFCFVVLRTVVGRVCACPVHLLPAATNILHDLNGYFPTDNFPRSISGCRRSIYPSSKSNGFKSVHSPRWEKPGNNVLKNFITNWIFVFLYSKAGYTPEQIFRLYYGVDSDPVDDVPTATHTPAS